MGNLLCSRDINNIPYETLLLLDIALDEYIIEVEGCFVPRPSRITFSVYCLLATAIKREARNKLLAHCKEAIKSTGKALVASKRRVVGVVAEGGNGLWALPNVKSYRVFYTFPLQV